MNTLLPLLAICCIAPAFCLLGVGSTQSTAVSGTLMCNGRPATGVKVKLYEKEATMDVMMDEGVTDAQGMFRLSGSKTEITTIDPRVNFYHTCNFNGPCYKKIGITIPDSYVTAGELPSKTFDVGTINLADQFSGQSTDCLN